MGLVHVHAIDAAGCYDADRRAVGGQRTDLHGAGVGAQDVGRAGVSGGARHEEGVMLLPGGMLGRDVQRVEVVPVGFDLRAFGHGKAHVGEDGGQFLHHLTDGVDRACGARAARQRHVQPFGAEAFVQRRIGKARAAGAQGGVDFVLQQVQARPGGLALVRVHATKGGHQGRNLALLAKRRQPHLFQRRLFGRSGNGGKVSAPDRVKPVHLRPSLASPHVLAAGRREGKNRKARRGDRGRAKDESPRRNDVSRIFWQEHG